MGAAEAMRTWVREKNSFVSNIAVQVGLELWLHDGAVVLLRMDCLADAEHHAREALKLQPGNASLKKTLDDIRFAQTNAPPPRRIPTQNSPNSRSCRFCGA